MEEILMNHILRVKAANRDIFTAIRSGRKKVETRAATARYRNVKVGDSVVFACGKSKLSKEVRKVRIFRTIRGLSRVYKPVAINPACRTVKELELMCFSFPGYREKLRKHGIIALELK